MPDALTTPGCVTVHRRLRELADAGARHVAVEVSSHALDQGRVDGVAFRIAAFTNLTRDHLDYHGDLASYGARQGAPVSRDAAPPPRSSTSAMPSDASSPRACRAARASYRCLPPAATPPAPRRCSRPGASPATAAASASCSERAGEHAEFVSPLLGAFNVENLAVAAGILLAEGFRLRRHRRGPRGLRRSAGADGARPGCAGSQAPR